MIHQIKEDTIGGCSWVRFPQKDIYRQIHDIDGMFWSSSLPPLKGALIDKGIRTDFAVALAGAPACTRACWEKIKFAVEKEVETISIDVDGDDFVLLNVVNLVECLNLLESRIVFVPNTSKVLGVSHFVFDESKLSSCYLFKIPQHHGVLCTERFRRLIIDNRITGLVFVCPKSIVSI
jgi:hypothetical protein